MASKYLLSWVIAGLLAAPWTIGCRAAEPKWLHSIPVVFKDNHDPSLILLQDGQVFEVLYDIISLEEVNAWREGRKLSLSYSSRTGPVLLDYTTGKWIPLKGGWRRHPLDAYADKLMEVAIRGTNAKMIAAATKTINLWKVELERLETELKRRLRGKHRAAFEKSQQAWREFKAAEISLVNALNDEHAGTQGSVDAGNRISSIHRDRALMLYGYLVESTE